MSVSFVFVGFVSHLVKYWNLTITLLLPSLKTTVKILKFLPTINNYIYIYIYTHMQAFSFLIGCLLFQYIFLLLEVVDSTYQLNLFNNIYVISLSVYLQLASNMWWIQIHFYKFLFSIPLHALNWLFTCCSHQTK